LAEVDNSGGKSGSPELIPQAHGGALLSGGVPGNKGGTGRPPNWFAAKLRECRDRDEVVEELKRAMADRADPNFLAAIKFATERLEGRVPDAGESPGDVAARYVVLPVVIADPAEWARIHAQPRQLALPAEIVQGGAP
jgi:hypothetical protein